MTAPKHLLVLGMVSRVKFSISVPEINLVSWSLLLALEKQHWISYSLQESPRSFRDCQESPHNAMGQFAQCLWIYPIQALSPVKVCFIWMVSIRSSTPWKKKASLPEDDFLPKLSRWCHVPRNSFARKDRCEETFSTTCLLPYAFPPGPYPPQQAHIHL